MSIALLLGVENACSIEPSFADLTEDIWTDHLLQYETIEARLVVDEYDDPLALGILSGGLWVVGSFLFRPMTIDALHLFEETGGEIYQEVRERWLTAIREYYSIEIMKQVRPAVEDVSSHRYEVIRDLLKRVWGKGHGESCIECCCGSGVGASILRKIGMSPVAYDHDTSLLSLGLHTGRLDPAATMCIDATMAHRYCTHVPRATAFMLGTIDTFNASMWEQVVASLVSLADDTLITVGTEKEATLVGTWGRSRGCEISIEEHTMDPIFDRWICRLEHRQ